VFRPPEPVQVETGAPLLRVVLVVLVLLAVVAGVLVASRAQAGWIALGLAVVVGPVGVLVDGRVRNRSGTASPSPSPGQAHMDEHRHEAPRRAAQPNDRAFHPISPRKRRHSAWSGAAIPGAAARTSITEVS